MPFLTSKGCIFLTASIILRMSFPTRKACRTWWPARWEKDGSCFGPGAVNAQKQDDRPPWPRNCCKVTRSSSTKFVLAMVQSVMKIRSQPLSLWIQVLSHSQISTSDWRTSADLLTSRVIFSAEKRHKSWGKAPAPQADRRMRLSRPVGTSISSGLTNKHEKIRIVPYAR